MNFDLTDDQKALRSSLIRFARERLNGDVLDRDREQRFSQERWLACGELGVQGLPVPVDLGGAGHDPLATALALEALGYGCEDGGLLFSICAHLLACVVPVWKHGSEEQRRRYLPKLCSGTWIAANAMSEASAASDAYTMAARAVEDGDGFRLQGSKLWCTNAPVADLFLVYAATDAKKAALGGISAFLVERSTKGLSLGREVEKMGLRTSPMGELHLDDVWLPRTSLLGEVGAGATIFNQSMNWERTCIAAVHCGTMQRLMEKAIKHARGRRAFGQPIGQFQAVSHAIADMQIRLETSRLLSRKAASKLDRARDVIVDACMTKVHVSEALVETALAAVQIFGGSGFATEYEIERALRDSVGGKIYSGTNEVLRGVLATWLGLP